MITPAKVYVVVGINKNYNEDTEKFSDSIHIFKHRHEILEFFPIIGDEYRLTNIIAGKSSGKKGKNKDLREFLESHVIMQISIVSLYIYNQYVQDAVIDFLDDEREHYYGL